MKTKQVGRLLVWILCLSTIFSAMVIPTAAADGHSYVNGVCSCGDSLITISDAFSDATVTVTDVAAGVDGDNCYAAVPEKASISFEGSADELMKEGFSVAFDLRFDGSSFNSSATNKDYASFLLLYGVDTDVIRVFGYDADDDGEYDKFYLISSSQAVKDTEAPAGYSYEDVGGTYLSNKNAFFEMDANEWYRLGVTVDTDNKKVYIKNLENGEILYTEEGADLNGADGGIRLGNPQTRPQAYVLGVDNVVLTPAKEYSSSPLWEKGMVEGDTAKAVLGADATANMNAAYKNGYAYVTKDGEKLPYVNYAVVHDSTNNKRYAIDISMATTVDSVVDSSIPIVRFYKCNTVDYAKADLVYLEEDGFVVRYEAKGAHGGDISKTALYNANGERISPKTTLDANGDPVKFTALTVVVDEPSDTYSVYVDGSVAYLDAQGKKSAVGLNMRVVAGTGENETVDQPYNHYSQSNAGDYGFTSGTTKNHRLRLFYGAYNYYVDEVSMTVLDGSINFVGTQDKANDTTFDIRFLAATSNIYRDEIGFQLEVVGADDKEPWKIYTDSIYSEIACGTDEYGRPLVDYVANCKDGDYYTALILTGVPKINAEVGYTFIVTPIYAESLTGENVAGEAGDAYLVIYSAQGEYICTLPKGDCVHTATIGSEATEPTCTEPGYTESWECSKCGEELKAAIETAPASHTFDGSSAASYNGTTVTKNCSVCGGSVPFKNDGYISEDFETDTSNFARPSGMKTGTEGDRDYMYSPDGTNVFVKKSGTDPFGGTDIYTISFDFKITDANKTAAQRLLALRAGSNTNYLVNYTTDATTATIYDGKKVYSHKINLNEWHTLMVVVDQTAKIVRVYVDGVSLQGDNALGDEYLGSNMSGFRFSQTNTYYDNFVMSKLAPGGVAHTHTPGAEATCTSAQVCTECGEVLVPALPHTIDNSALASYSGTVVTRPCSVCGGSVIFEENGYILNLPIDGSVIDKQSVNDMYVDGSGATQLQEGDRYSIKFAGTYIIRLLGSKKGISFKDLDVYTISFDFKINAAGNKSSVVGLRNTSNANTYPLQYNYTAGADTAEVLAGGNAKTIQAADWHEAMIVVDQTAKKARVYIDGDYLGDYSMSDDYIGEKMYGIRIVGGENQYDNIKIAKVAPTNDIVESQPESHIAVAMDDVAATCTTPGQTGGTFCKKCGETLEEPTVVPALGHEQVAIYTGTTISKECTRCGEEASLKIDGDILNLPIDGSDIDKQSFGDFYAQSTSQKHTDGNRTSVSFTADSYIRKLSSAEPFDGIDVYTISFDFKINDTSEGSGKRLLGLRKNDNTNNTLVNYETTSGKTRVYDGTKKHYQEINVNEWHTLVVVVDQTAKIARVYVDGVYLEGNNNISDHVGTGMKGLRFTNTTTQYDNIKITKWTEGAVEDIEGLDVLLAGKLDASKQDQYITAKEDAYVRAGSYAGKTYNGDTLEMKASDGDVHRVVYLKFDISDLKSGVTSAILRLKCTSLDIDGTALETNILAYGCDDTSWSEGTITYNNRPARGSLIKRYESAELGIVTIDLTSYVKSAIAAGKEQITVILEGEVTAQEDRNATRLMFDSKDSAKGTAPVLCVEYGTAGFTTDLGYKFTDVNPWSYAMDLVTTFQNRWLTLSANKGSNNPTKIPENVNEYKTVVGAAKLSATDGANTVYTPYQTRILQNLINYTVNSSEKNLYDAYGGYMGGDKYTAKGFFYTTKNSDGRWLVIDPLGYPYYRVAMNAVSIKSASKNAYGGTTEGAANGQTNKLFELGFNSAGAWSDHADLLAVDEPLSQSVVLYMMRDYADKLGLNATTSGNTDLKGGIMPVFDPGFEAFCESSARSQIKQYVNNPYIFGWMLDNELPGAENMLDSCLTLDPTDPTNWYSYATAWTFMYVETGKTNVSISDVTPALREKFQAMVWDRYYEVTTTAVRAVDENHMILGSRLYSGTWDEEYILKACASWCDIISANMYSQWTPDSNWIANVEKWTDTPFIITEFYAKGNKDTGFTNKQGAGFAVEYQTDRGYFYQNFALKLLEAKNCVGFDWFKYWDDSDSNKGIYNSDHVEYTNLTKYMKELNLNKYSLIEFFDGRS